MIACVSVNDAFVMSAWGESSGATGKIRMLADTTAEFTKVCLNRNLRTQVKHLLKTLIF